MRRESIRTVRNPGKTAVTFPCGRVLIASGAVKRYLVPMSYNVQVAVVGGGPTGALLGCLLGRAGVDTVILERNHAIPSQSRAIGITPPSLEILGDVGLAARFVELGVAARRAVVYDERSELGAVEFDAVHPGYPFVLSIPQRDTLALLRECVGSLHTVQLLLGRDVVQLEQDRDGVTLVCENGDTVRARFAVAADGAHSSVAVGAVNARRRKLYRQRFFMADHIDRYRDGGRLGDDAHLWFTPDGAVESFPLPGGIRRWIVQLTRPAPDGDVDLEAIVARRAGVLLYRTDRLWESRFTPERSEVKRFAIGRLFFAGDAAHTMSPIGGQGMNTGFADAELLARTLIPLLTVSERSQRSQRSQRSSRSERSNRSERRDDAAPASAALIGRYEYARRVAFRSAARRAAAGMWVGTIRGRIGSRLRSVMIRLALRVAMPAVARHFSMQTIPFRRAGDSHR